MTTKQTPTEPKLRKQRQPKVLTQTQIEIFTKAKEDAKKTMNEARVLAKIICGVDTLSDGGLSCLEDAIDKRRGTLHPAQA